MLQKQTNFTTYHIIVICETALTKTTTNITFIVHQTQSTISTVVKFVFVRFINFTNGYLIGALLFKANQILLPSTAKFYHQRKIRMMPNSWYVYYALACNKIYYKCRKLERVYKIMGRYKKYLRYTTTTSWINHTSWEVNRFKLYRSFFIERP